MPDYLFAAQFESFFIFLQIKGQDLILKSDTNKTIPAPGDQRFDPLTILYMVNCTVCQDIERQVASEHPSRHDPETNQHTYLCPKIGPWKS